MSDRPRAGCHFAEGRGKLDRDRKADLPTKSIWLYPLSKHFRRSLRST